MVRAAAILLLVFAGWVFPAHANQGNATLRVVPYGIFKCPYPIDNGCAGATALQPGSGGILYAGGRNPGGAVNLLTASPTNYTNANAENYPGLEYPAGEFTSLMALSLPVSGGASTISGCVYSATGGANSSPRMVCTPTSAGINIIGQDFTLGGTTCISLLISGDLGVMDVEDNYWKNLTGSCSTSTTFPNVVQTTGRPTGTTIFKNNSLDADRDDWPYAIGSCTPTFALTCSPVTALLISGNFIGEYNYIKGFTQIPLSYSPQSGTVGWSFKHNVVEGACSNNTAAHCEIMKFIVGANNVPGSFEVLDSNTFIITTDHHTNGPSPFPAQLASPLSPPFTTISLFDVSDNFYVAGPSGGATNTQGPMTSHFSGTTFTVDSVTSGDTFGTGQLIICGSSADQVAALAVFTGSTGTTSAGPGGGGFGSAGATFQSIWQGSTISGTIDNGLGTGVGNVLTVTTDSTLVLEVGTNVAISGATRAITGSGSTGATCGPSACTGTGTTGTYLTGGAAAQATVAGFTATPLDIRPGMWSVPGTKSCPSQTIGVAPTSTPWITINGVVTQAISQNNSLDMYPFNNGVAGSTVISNPNATLDNFNGTIATTNLTYNSGTVPPVGYGLLTTGGVAVGTWINGGTSPNFTITPSSASLGPTAMVASQSTCGSVATLSGNVDMTGVWGSSLMNSIGPPTTSGNGCQ